MKKIILAMALMLCQITVKASSEEILAVDTTFPIKITHYPLEEFLAGFKLIVLDPLWKNFEEGWTIIYEGLEKGSVKRLPVEKETGHIRCLYSTLSGLKGPGNAPLEAQLLTINSSFSACEIHMQLIREKNAELAKRISD
tara:strand:+ start:1113 stop:1532 length:420 start_codon:yes stop_codon:yes gene_type:complete